MHVDGVLICSVGSKSNSYSIYIKNSTHVYAYTKQTYAYVLYV